MGVFSFPVKLFGKSVFGELKGESNDINSE